MGIIQQQTLSPEEIIKLFNAKEIDKDWSFVGYKPLDTAKFILCYMKISRSIEEMYE